MVQLSKLILRLCYLPIQVVEETQQVEGQLDPSLPLALVQRVSIHDGGWVVQTSSGHNRSVHVPGKTDPVRSFLQNLQTSKPPFTCEHGKQSEAH